MKDILCSHCVENYLKTDNEIKNGFCNSCNMRQSACRRHNTPYVKLKDLSLEERIKINKTRQSFKVKPLRIIQIDKIIEENPDLNEIALFNLCKKEIPDFDDKCLKYIQNYPITNKKEEPKSKSKNREVIYTPEIIEEIKSWKTENMTSAEIREALISLYPEKKITTGNLQNILVRQNINYLKTRGNDIVKRDIQKEAEDLKEKFLNVKVPAVPIKESIENEPKTMLDTIEKIMNNFHNLKDLETEIEKDNIQVIPEIPRIEVPKEIKEKVKVNEERLKDIFTEVDNILEAKYKEEGCEFDTPYDIDDFIKAFEVMMFLFDNRYNILNNGKRQHMITDAYERDIVHACENMIAEPGDTYLQDKLYCLRTRRRQIEYLGRDIGSLLGILKSPTYFNIKRGLSTLKYHKECRENIKYIPYVDKSMIEKYNWCIEGYKSIPDLVALHSEEAEKIFDNIEELIETEETEEKPKTDKSGKVINSYRVSCKISGGGYGVFSPWYRDYETTSQDIALAYATNTLNQLKQNKPGILVQDIEVHKLN